MEISRDFASVEVLWEPDENSGKLMRSFMKRIEEKYSVKIKDYWDVHKWSVDNLSEFWEEIWNLLGVIYSKPHDKVIDLSVPLYEPQEWFSGARMNFAENLLKYRDEHIAMITAGEDRGTERVTYAEMYEESKLYSAALRNHGVKKGDRVSCFMSNRKEAVFAMMGAVSLGAIWVGALPLMGSQAVLNRFQQVKPKVLFSIDRFPHNREEKEMLPKLKEIAEGLPSLEKVVIIASKPESKLKDISGIRNRIPFSRLAAYLMAGFRTAYLSFYTEFAVNVGFLFLSRFLIGGVAARVIAGNLEICFLDDFLQIGKNPDGSVPEMVFEQVAFTHPVFISYTSGTTGLPKPIIHGSCGLLAVYRDFWLQADGNRTDCWLSMSPVGWASWNMFTTMHSLGFTVILFEGLPYFLSPTFLWDMVDEFQITNLLLTPSVMDDLEKKGYLPTERNHLTSLKMIMGGGSVVKTQNYDFAYKKVKPGIIFSSAYGCTELHNCMIFDRTLKVHKGEIAAPSLGIDLQCVDDAGKTLYGEVGELIVNQTTTCLPLGLWGDTDRSLFKSTYCNKYPGKFAIGDLAVFNPITGGLLICGRSDDTLKPGGCRFGCSEIYNIVDTFYEVRDSICVSQYNKNLDERAVLFLKMREGHLFNENLVRRLRETIARELSIRHVPGVILETADIPYNLNGKKMEIIVKKIINKIPYNAETVINPECLQYFSDVPELFGF